MSHPDGIAKIALSSTSGLRVTAMELSLANPNTADINSTWCKEQCGAASTDPMTAYKYAIHWIQQHPDSDTEYRFDDAGF